MQKNIKSDQAKKNNIDLVKEAQKKAGDRRGFGNFKKKDIYGVGNVLIMISLRNNLWEFLLNIRKKYIKKSKLIL